MGRPVLFVTFLAAIGLISWQELKLYRQVPRPERFLYAAVVWGLLGVVSEVGGDDIAAVFSVGLLLALIYQFYTTGQTSISKPEQAPGSKSPSAIQATQANPATQLGG